MSVKVQSPFLKDMGRVSRALIRPKVCVHDHKSILFVLRRSLKIKDIVCVMEVSTYIIQFKSSSLCVYCVVAPNSLYVNSNQKILKLKYMFLPLSKKSVLTLYLCIGGGLLS